MYDVSTSKYNFWKICPKVSISVLSRHGRFHDAYFIALFYLDAFFKFHLALVLYSAMRPTWNNLHHFREKENKRLQQQHVSFFHENNRMLLHICRAFKLFLSSFPCEWVIKGIVHPKYNSVINYSPSCLSKPVRPSFIFRTQNKIFLM